MEWGGPAGLRHLLQEPNHSGDNVTKVGLTSMRPCMPGVQGYGHNLSAVILSNCVTRFLNFVGC